MRKALVLKLRLIVIRPFALLLYSSLFPYRFLEISKFDANVTVEHIFNHVYYQAIRLLYQVLHPL